ncbi:hypothetical protein C8Q78DRAFT_1078852 [Trametes maxima]|nr:hypothetical protein C8Q78DRAFT_1078852 [Trametes maxima]
MPTLLQQVKTRARAAARLGKRLFTPRAGNSEDIRGGYYYVGHDSVERFFAHIMVEQSSIVSYDAVPYGPATQHLGEAGVQAAQEFEEEDDIDLYYFSACSEEYKPDSAPTVPAAEVVDPEDDEQMPGGWPAVYVTVTAADSDREVNTLDVKRYLTAQFLAATESVSENVGAISASCIDADGFLCVPRVGPSPSVVVVLEEFANSPPAGWANDSSVDLWSFSRSPSSVNLLVPPEHRPATSPEFALASNFAKAGHLTAAASGASYYPLNSILEQYIGDEEGDAETLCPAAPPESVPPQPITPCDTALNFFDSYFNLSHDDSEEDSDSTSGSDATCVSSERDGDTSPHEVVPTSEFKSSLHEPFDELWQLAQAEAFYEPLPEPDREPETHCGDQTFTKETFWTPATSRLPNAVDPHREGLVQDAHATFWTNRARPSDADLASIFEHRDEAPSGLFIFVEEDGRVDPLPGNDSGYIPHSLAVREQEARERSMRRKLQREERERIQRVARRRLKEVARAQFLDRWELALD